MLPNSGHSRRARLQLVLGILVILQACASGADRDPTDGIYDPFEDSNRKVHAFNRGLDRAIVRPAAKGYTNILPDEVEDRVGDFARNLSSPSVAVNSLLQGDLGGTWNATLRFVMNTTLGFGGLVDVASEFGVRNHRTNFGETLHVWGVGEGAYVELPLIGPSTQRDAVGIVVDLFSNPLSYKLDNPEELYPPLSAAAAGLGNRGRYSDTVDSILYESADSYAQSRLIYLQNRRFDLGIEDETAEIDPFELDTEGF